MSATLKITADDCRSCGACCVSGNPNGEDVLDYGYADLTKEDVARMSRHVRAKLQEIFVVGETRYATRAKQLPSGRYACQHLRGTPGRRCSCTIYDTQPEICQRFRVGGTMCRLARLAAGLGPGSPPLLRPSTARLIDPSTLNKKATLVP